MGITPKRPIIFTVPIVLQKKGIAKNSGSQTKQENMANFHKLDSTHYCCFFSINRKKTSLPPDKVNLLDPKGLCRVPI